ncbi:unnamed protein product [Acanthoscelides obtectus]|uniref:Uncharacterized protein n=1 Tax=Acanthoscelides obtectus TaxID=200917 RepID=A0A9P0LNB5_ACAOB|nr:unnamed protein product [Acanthoscelides obtectus]CAK1626063.1 hypothetical protein AOBTE_LOCUS3576 [Acanthoscelides obtectus]
MKSSKTDSLIFLSSEYICNIYTRSIQLEFRNLHYLPLNLLFLYCMTPECDISTCH